MQRRKDVLCWLKKLDLVREELRSTRFPRTAEEGLRQCAELSAVSMGLFKEEIRKALRTRGEGPVERETRRLMARFSSTDGRWKAGRKEARVTP
jgi:hypothetical protein